MATITETYWQCDRCGGKAPKAPPGYSGVKLVGAITGEFSMEENFSWSELCGHCSQVVRKEIRGIVERSRPVQPKLESD